MLRLFTVTRRFYCQQPHSVMQIVLFYHASQSAMSRSKHRTDAINLERISAQGWTQFLTKKKEMLDAYRSGKRYSKGRPVRASHGRVAEAEFRRWLTEFLPKRFAVTGGYIVSYSLSEQSPLLHSDVIVYDQLASPVLWVERNSDESRQGNVRAIPAEHVYAILEVKSRLTRRNAVAAIHKLELLRPLLRTDPDSYRYPRFLPASFSSHVVFFELPRTEMGKTSIMDGLVPRTYLRGYAGGLVLSGDGLSEDSAGQLSLSVSKEPIAPMTPGLPGGACMSESVEYEPGAHFNMMLLWSENAFAQFAFDLVARLTGVYRPGFVSSFHGMSIHGPKWPFST